MSKNDGGPAVTVARAAADKPDIPRGAMFPRGSFVGADRITFELVAHPFVLTYHDAAVISDGSLTPAQVFVGPQDVVTWERV